MSVPAPGGRAPPKLPLETCPDPPPEDAPLEPDGVAAAANGAAIAAHKAAIVSVRWKVPFRFYRHPRLRSDR